MPELHYFNPGHESAILDSSPHYTPSVNVRKMQRDLSLLPLWYGQAGDYVWVEQEPDPAFWDDIPSVIRPEIELITSTGLKKITPFPSHLEAAPWGISPQSVQLFHGIRKTSGIDLKIIQWNDLYKKMTHRSMSAICLQKIKEKCSGIFLPHVPVFIEDLPTIEQYLINHPGRYILKAPYSSSGRGLLWVEGGALSYKDRQWINGILRKQGSISLERSLDKVSDYGLEFFSDGQGSIQFTGISPFKTHERGAYSYTYIGNQQRIQEEIEKQTGADIFRDTSAALKEVLTDLYASVYTGYIGVDTLIYRKDTHYYFHPCVEINMRNTMGHVALQLQRLIDPSSQAKFFVTYDKDPHKCQSDHLIMREKHPITMYGNKIKEGYLSLCPVQTDTNYKAYLLVSY